MYGTKNREHHVNNRRVFQQILNTAFAVHSAWEQYIRKLRFASRHRKRKRLRVRLADGRGRLSQATEAQNAAKKPLRHQTKQCSKVQTMVPKRGWNSISYSPQIINSYPGPGPAGFPGWRMMYHTIDVQQNINHSQRPVLGFFFPKYELVDANPVEIYSYHICSDRWTVVNKLSRLPCLCVTDGLSGHRD